MSALAITPPFPIFCGTDGKPLDGGRIYIGVANQNPETHPISVYWDSNLVQPAAQPIRTSGGYPVRGGTPSKLYMNGFDYSITVRDRHNRIVYAALSCNPVNSSEVIDVTADPFNAVGDGIADDTSAINAAFEAGRLAGKPVYAPSGTYLVGELQFGTQSLVSQSSAPTGLYGDGWTTTFKAKPGFTGTVLKAWSLAGVSFKDFAVDGNGTATSCIDTDWKPGVGPSLQNVYERISCRGSTGTVWSCKNNNDCTFKRCSVNGADHSKIGFDYDSPGGLAWLDDCTWNNCYLRISCQNGALYNCWGHGIEFAQGGVNYIELIGGYIYGNTVKAAVVWSQSFASFQSVHGLHCLTTQFIGEGVPAYFNLNAYSKIVFGNCWWIGTATAMFGASCRTDSFAKVKVLFEGGSVYGTLVVNQPTGFIIERDGLMDNTTAKTRPDYRSLVYKEDGNSADFSSGSYYDFIGSGSLETGTYLIEWRWNHNGVGQPWELVGSALVSILPDDAGVANGPDIPAVLNSYFVGDGQALAFRLVGTGAGVKIQFKWTSGATSGPTLKAPGAYTWKAIKLA